MTESVFSSMVAEATALGSSEDRAREYVSGVSAALRDAAPTGELEDAAAQLPQEYGELLAAN